MARVLIVEDSAYLAKALRRFLEDEGHEVLAVAENGFEGVAGFEAHRPDLTLMDITMPGMDGRTCLAEILRIDPEARVLMVSAIQTRNAIISCLSAGARGYVEKPLRFHDPDFQEDFRASILEALKDG